MEFNLKSFQMEDDLNYFQIEDNDFTIKGCGTIPGDLDFGFTLKIVPPNLILQICHLKQILLGIIFQGV